MKGVQFIINDRGQKTGAVLDLRELGEVWEDIYDNLLAQERENEPRESLASVEERLRQQGKLDERT